EVSFIKPVKTVDYIGEFIYENNEIALIQHEEGRIVPALDAGPRTYEYEYYLKDHLGNTRVVFTTDPKTIDFGLNYESNSADPDDETLFDNLQNVITADIHDRVDAGNESFNHTNVQALNGAADGVIGSVLTIPVGAGDKVSAEVYAKYLAPTGTNNPAAAVGNLVIGAITGTTGTGIYEGAITSGYGSGGTVTSLINTNASSTEPMAFINLLFLPDDVTGSIATDHFTFKQVTSASSNSQAILALDQPYEAPESGYVVIYLSNESAQLTEVYFDDLKVTVNEHPVIQTDDYYPFGMQMAGGYQRVTAKENRFLYNGKEKIEDLGIDWYDYGARMYMSDIGRWSVIDPMNEIMPEWSPYNYTLNNPLRYIDPDGMIPFPVHLNFKGFKRRVSSWFGKRNVRNNPRATVNHKGLDINFGSGNDDFGASVIATHDGKVHEVKDNPDGNGGRKVVIQAEDGSFQTLYFHLSKVTVSKGDEVKEGTKIGEIGSSAFGSETGADTHLHYGIKKRNEKTNKLEWFNPTEGKGNEESNIVDPQSWLEDPLGDAYKNIVDASSAGNLDDVSKWIQEFERLKKEQEDENN
ncbi:MAG: peptidoglycan DD-metalloendopeptidase family protein, partial [Bacteroidota bacterium]